VEEPSRPLRVHRVIARLNVGGPAMHVVNLTRGLRDTGRYETTLLAGRITPDEGDMGWYAERHDVTPVWLDALGRRVRPLADVGTLRRLVAHFRATRPDIVHTHTAKAGALGRLAARLAGVPIVLHTYHGHVLGGDYFSPTVTRAYRAIEGWLAKRTDRLVVLTEGQARELSADLGVAPREQLEVIPLGLELARFRGVERPKVREATRAAMGVPGGAHVIGMVGRMVPVKDHDLFLEAFARLRELEHARGDAAPLEAWLVGSGERETELRATAGRLGLEGCVRWLGWRDDLPRLLPAMDVVALTSLDEGTPVALIEAIAAGTPVAAVAVGGVGDVLRGAGLEAGLLPASAGRSGDGFARLVSRVLHHPRWVGGQGLPDAHRDHVVTRYATPRLVRDIDALYTRLAVERGLASPSSSRHLPGR